jgi:hypothetical protein
MKKNRGGRPPKPPGEKQSEKIQLSLTPRERAQLDAAAGREPVASFLRRIVLRTLARQQRRDGRTR